jgi:hypothetical protein
VNAFESGLETGRQLEAAVAGTEVALKQFPRLANGLVTDDVAATPEYKAAKAAFNKAFAQLRQFNGAFMKLFKNEYRAYRNQKRKTI